MIVIDPAIDQLNQMLGDASLKMNDAIGAETFNLPWRVNIRRHLSKGANKLIADYSERRDDHGCDPNQEVKKGPADAEEALERALPEACRETAQPLKQLAVQLRNWRNTFNRCGDGPTRDGFNQRMTKLFRNIRKRAYNQLGCDL